jgi:hypothetical protein
MMGQTNPEVDLEVVVDLEVEVGVLSSARSQRH